MPKRNSLQQLESADDLSNFNELVVDKRYGKRAKAKKARRNRHYEKQFLKNAVSSGLVLDIDGDDGCTEWNLGPSSNV
ncbi:hypothetical protein [Limnobacter sp.]|uniref:hypothetical protein n=1 Tax=Limnobacter sp. TaxID=2003368 RepID=UPI003516372D